MVLKEKVVLITGGSRGIGRETALTLSKNKLVVITYNENKESADNVLSRIKKSGGHAVAIQLNVSELKTFPNFVEKLSTILQEEWGKTKIDYIVNNAGIGLSASLSDINEDQFDKLVSVHLKGPLFFTQSMLPLINDGGAIINISSGLTRFTTPGMGVYASVKGALEILTRYMAQEFSAKKIRVNAIAPGIVRTEFGGNDQIDTNFDEFISQQTLLGRLGEPKDIATVIDSVLEDNFSWVTGQRIEASGGLFI